MEIDWVDAVIVGAFLAFGLWDVVRSANKRLDKLISIEKYMELQSQQMEKLVDSLETIERNSH